MVIFYHYLNLYLVKHYIRTSLVLGKRQSVEKLSVEDVNQSDGFKFLTSDPVTKSADKQKAEKSKKLKEEKQKVCSLKLNYIVLHFQTIVHVVLQSLELRQQFNINVGGIKIPPPIESFASLSSEYKFSEALITNIENSKYAKPTPVQMQVIPAIMKVRDDL